MNSLSETTTTIFTFLSIGQRAVGKTVFLAGSYAELHSDSQTKRLQQLWFECLDTQEQENVESILSYVVQTGQYPPPTIKMTNFNFSLKRQSLEGVQTLCHFRWWDVPGEVCNIENLDFKTVMAASQACCVFIDAYALTHNDAYIQKLEDMITLVEATADLVSLNGFKYPFALILTKCDLLEPDPITQQQLQEGLQPLITSLDIREANYQTFYSSIPIVHTESAVTLKAKGAAAPLLWLVWELSKAHNLSWMNDLHELVTSLLPTSFQPQQVRTDASMQSMFTLTGKATGVKKVFGLYSLASSRRAVLLIVLAIAALLEIITPFFINYKQIFQNEESQNLNSMENLAALHESRGQFYQALPLMEKLVALEPERVDLRLHLANLYQFTGQAFKAEIVYDQVLTQQNNNFKALVGKATLRSAQGDIKTATAMFAQAEKAAPIDLKAQIRAVAQNTLQPPNKPIRPNAK